MCPSCLKNMVIHVCRVYIPIIRIPPLKVGGLPSPQKNATTWHPWHIWHPYLSALLGNFHWFLEMGIFQPWMASLSNLSPATFQSTSFFRGDTLVNYQLAGWLENDGPGLKMYFLLNMGIFQPAMLVYQRVCHVKLRVFVVFSFLWKDFFLWMKCCDERHFGSVDTDKMQFLQNFKKYDCISPVYKLNQQLTPETIKFTSIFKTYWKYDAAASVIVYWRIFFEPNSPKQRIAVQKGHPWRAGLGWAPLGALEKVCARWHPLVVVWFTIRTDYLADTSIFKTNTPNLRISKFHLKSMRQVLESHFFD